MRTQTENVLSGFRLTASQKRVLTAPLFVTTLCRNADTLEAIGLITVTERAHTKGHNSKAFCRYELTGMGEAVRTELKEKRNG